MCCRHGHRRQPPIVALAGAIYGAYQDRKEKRAEASVQDIGLEGGKYAAVSQHNHSDTMDEFGHVDKSVPPPNYEDVVNDYGDTLHHDVDSKDIDNGMCDDGVAENALLAADSDNRGRRGVKMGFFERLHAKKEEKRLEREERREIWRAEKRAWVQSRAERRAEWRAGMGRRGCGRQVC